MSPSPRLFLATLFLCALCLVAGHAADSKDEPKLKISEDEQTILDMTNQARAKEKLPPLKPNRILFEVARAHSANMARKGEMKHELDGKNPAERVKDAGYNYTWVAENIATGEGWSLDEVMTAWMNSKVHRENILGSNYTEIGIGIGRNDKGEVYYTQVFATPMKRR